MLNYYHLSVKRNLLLRRKCSYDLICQLKHLMFIVKTYLKLLIKHNSHYSQLYRPFFISIVLCRAIDRRGVHPICSFSSKDRWVGKGKNRSGKIPYRRMFVLHARIFTYVIGYGTFFQNFSVPQTFGKFIVISLKFLKNSFHLCILNTFKMALRLILLYFFV